jgi:transposase
MKARTIVLHPQTRAKLKRLARQCRDADTRLRYLIVVRSSEGWSGKRICKALGCSTSTVSRTLDRYEALGEAGLVDRREDNGDRKADASYVAVVRWILDGTPLDFFHRRPTWTKALLIETARRYTGMTVSKTTMGRVLKQLKARRGRPKPLAPCPWSKARKKQRIALIHALIDTLPPDQACVWEDEADVDLNPRIGADWMLPGTQRTVIHVVLDNYTIHSSRQTRLWLEEFGQKFRLHFLPPYCPDDNRIERKVWREMHANVTVNHRRETIETLCDDVIWYLMKHNRDAAKLGVRESRRAI